MQGVDGLGSVVGRAALPAAWLVVVLVGVGCGSKPPSQTGAPSAPPPAPPPPPGALELPAAVSGAQVDAGAVTPGFVRIRAGRFLMGSQPDEAGRAEHERQVEVTIRRDFEMQATEVTNAAWRALLGTPPSAQTGCEACPVEQVSWHEAVAYCEALSKRRGLPACTSQIDPKNPTWQGVHCRGYRLPTEAEWEYAARAGTLTARYGEAEEVAWLATNAALRPRPVGSKASNPWGLYDMLGNVAEWVWDWYDSYPTAAVADPVGPAQGQNKVFRGGSARYPAEEARAASRAAYGPGNKVDFIGFRCVRTLAP